MVIDQTRYAAFLRNPEAYRLKYCKNLVSKEQAYGLARGTALHLILELDHKGKTRAEIQVVLDNEVKDDKAKRVAWAMFAEWKRKYSTQPSLMCGSIVTKMIAEHEFKHAIPGSVHEIAGRIDEILTWQGKLMCGEVKTANSRSDFAQVQHDWQHNPQADFEMLGARMSGYQVEGVLVRVIREVTPVQIWELDVYRTQEQLDVMLLNVDQICNTIELYKQYYGIEQPWPHNASAYPCSRPGTCEYEGICKLANPSLAGVGTFGTRQEHLTCLGGATRA